MFSNEDLLTNIGCTSRCLKLDTKSGETRANKMSVFFDLRVWLSAESITNMLSVSHAASRCRFIMDSENEPDVKVEIASGACMRFVLNGTGLHVNDVGDNN